MVALERDAVAVRATERFLCKLARPQRGRALAAQAKDAEMKQRLAAFRERPARPADAG